jgi:hypothetical protein
MSTLFSYLTSWWETSEEIKESYKIPMAPSLTTTLLNDTISSKFNKITAEEITKVKLKPIKITININPIPSPARNIPPNLSKFKLTELNQAQLRQILQVKLKPVSKTIIKRGYEPRHPVLKELLQIRKKIC